MSIHRALSELKTYSDRIKRATQGMFVIANKKSNDKIQGKTIDEVTSAIQGNFDSCNALIENKRRIKSAVILSNANTKVTIGGTEYCVAEAIDRKGHLPDEENLLHAWKVQFIQQNEKVEKENAELQNKLEKYLQPFFGDKDKRTITPEEIAAHTQMFEDRNKYELIDPCDIATKIKEKEQEIIRFKTEVDYALSESNATTFIEIELVD